MNDKDVFRRFYEQTWNAGDVLVLDTVLAPTFHNHMLLASGDHRAAYCQAVLETRQAFPNWHLDILEIVAENNLVVAHWSATGTHLGRAWNIEPSGCHVELQGLTMVRLNNGKITDFWKYDTGATLLHQLTNPHHEE